jgi:hypothetical protein
LAQAVLVEFLVLLTELLAITRYFHLSLVTVVVSAAKMILQAATAVQAVVLVALEAEFDLAELQHQGKEITVAQVIVAVQAVAVVELVQLAKRHHHQLKGALVALVLHHLLMEQALHAVAVVVAHLT